MPLQLLDYYLSINHSLYDNITNNRKTHLHSGQASTEQHIEKGDL